jgi:hypothetical protein
MEFLEPITLAAPHIYLSALPFAPQNSKISVHFLKLFQKILTVKMGQMEDWSEKCFLRLADHAAVASVAFSPDGRHIVSGSHERQSECGMLKQVRVSWILLKAMMILLLQLHFLLMEGTLSLDLGTRQSECGMLRQVRVSWILSKAMISLLLQLHFLLMAGTLSLDLMTRQSECGMLRQVRVS